MSNDIAKMNDKQLRNEVQSLRDELAVMKRKYEDIIYNLDDDNFSSRFVKEKGDMRTAIEINADGIKTKVSNEEFESTKTQTANLISSEVKKLSEKDTELSTKITQTATEIRAEVKSATETIDGKFDNYSTIEQTANAIKSHAYASADLSSAKEISNLADRTDIKKTYVISTTDGSGKVTKTYYYYNDISGKWEEIIGGGIETVFEQTSEGFKLKGNVLIDGGSVTWDSSNSPVQTQYSADGVSWHPSQTVYDKYIRFSFDGGNEWNDATQIVGDTGPQGIQGPQGPQGEKGDKGDSANVPTYIKNTYIDSTKILSPDIWGGKFYATGKGANNGAAYYISDGYSQINNVFLPTRLLGYISYDDSGAGTKEEAAERVFFTTSNDIALKFHSGGNMSLEADGGTIHFMSDVQFHGATNIGSSGGGTPIAVFG